MKEKTKILIYGYGNPGRKDDGAGPALVKQIEKWAKDYGLDGIDFDSNYQLNIEDALLIRDYDIVIFADATVEEIEDFKMTRITSSDKVHFTMHAVNPAFVVDLCKKLYGRSPDAYLVHIKGYDFRMVEGLTAEAEDNLRKAFEHIKEFLPEPGKLTIHSFNPEVTEGSDIRS